MKRVALFFGSFNPIHNGHLILANYIAEFCEVDEVRFIVSPQNPFKRERKLLPDGKRLTMAKTATEGYDKFSVSDIEYHLPKPSYTIDTIEEMRRTNKDESYILIMGSDNLPKFHLWRNVEKIVEACEVWVYPRPNCEAQIPLEFPEAWKKKIRILKEAPMVEISSTMVRDARKNGRDLRFFVPRNVWNMLQETTSEID